MIASLRARVKPWIDAPALPAAALIAGLLFVFEPAQIYARNHDFFLFHFAYALPVLVLAATVLVLLLSVPAAFGGPRWRRWAGVGLVGIATASWGTATFLTASHGSLDGSTMTALPWGARLLRDAGYVAFAAGGGALAYFRPALMGRLLGALVLVLSGQAAWIAAMDPKPTLATPSFERVATLSKERNVLVFVLDTFQSDFFAEIIRLRPDLARAYKGFTYFENAVGHAPTTYLSIPPIHSGLAVDMQLAMSATYEKAVNQESFVAQLAKSGYDTVLLNPMMSSCPRGAVCASQEMVAQSPAEALARAASLLATLGLFRIVPESLKPVVLSGHDHPARIVDTSLRILRELSVGVRTGSARPVVRFLHLFVTHPPAVLDEQCESVPDRSWSRSTAVAQDTCAVMVFARLLERLEQQGLYDNTAIVVVADHGIVPTDPVDEQWREAASPLFLVKPFGARQPLRTSARLVGLLDVAATVCAWTKDCRASGGNDVTGPALEKPSYPFNAYVWDQKYWLEDRVPLFDRFVISGPPRDAKSWKRLAKKDEPPITYLDFTEDDPPHAFRRGWGHIEESVRRWGLGEESEIVLDLPSRASQIELMAQTHPGNVKQVMTVTVNGTTVAKLEIPTELTKLVVPVPAGLARDEGDIVTFRYANSSPPGAGDPRPLAVLFYRLEVR